MKNVTYVQLLAQVQEYKAEVASLESKHSSLPGSEFIKGALMRCSPLNSYAHALIHELTQRDEPMLRAEIEEVFKVSGFEYEQSDVDACYPDSQETVNKQIAYYRE